MARAKIVTVTAIAIPGESHRVEGDGDGEATSKRQPSSVPASSNSTRPDHCAIRVAEIALP